MSMDPADIVDSMADEVVQDTVDLVASSGGEEDGEVQFTSGVGASNVPHLPDPSDGFEEDYEEETKDEERQLKFDFSSLQLGTMSDIIAAHHFKFSEETVG